MSTEIKNTQEDKSTLPRAEKMKQLKRQMEYYLSDKNIQHDQFFYERVKMSADKGYFDLSLFLNCNNIKKFGNIQTSDLLESVENSEFVETKKVDDSFMIRRVGNKLLPNFLGKKLKNDIAEKEEKKQKEKLKDPRNLMNHMIENQDPIILQLSSDKDQAIKWKDLLKNIESQYNEFEIIYIRFSFQKGNAALFPKLNNTQIENYNQTLLNNNDLNLKESDNNENIKKLDNNRKSSENNALEISGDQISKVTTKTFEMEGINFTAALANEEELNTFWKEHGSHYEFCISTRLGSNPSQPKNKIRNRNNTNLLASEVKLGGLIFTEIGKIKSKARQIFYSIDNISKDLEIKNNEDKSFLLDLFKYIDSSISEFKENEIKITVEKLQKDSYSKSFFVQKGDSKKQSVSYLNSVLKCSIVSRKLKSRNNENNEEKK